MGKVPVLQWLSRHPDAICIQKTGPTRHELTLTPYGTEIAELPSPPSGEWMGAGLVVSNLRSAQTASPNANDVLTNLQTVLGDAATVHAVRVAKQKVSVSLVILLLLLLLVL